jgi:hypothetical protein
MFDTFGDHAFVNEKPSGKTLTFGHPNTTPTTINSTPGFNESLIDLEHLAIIADRSHLKSIKEKHQGKTTSSATQIDTITMIT